MEPDGINAQFLPPPEETNAPPISTSGPHGATFLGSVIDNLPVALFVKDATHEFRFVLWNKKQEEVTTISREDAIGKTDFDLFSQESAAYFREVDEAAIRSNRIFEVAEEIIDTVDAGEIWLHTVKVPVRDEALNRTLIIGISEDITERVKARIQLENLNRNLTEANQELQETQLQLIQAGKLESIGRLAAGVAHEVKNPLALLLLGVEYLSSGVDPSDPNLNDILLEMREAVERADRIICGLVDFSSQRQLSLEQTPIPTVIERSLLLIRHEITKNNVDVELEFEKDLPEAEIDSAKFEQILVNLFMNAIHAMAEQPQPTLGVRVFSEKLENVIRDEGARTAHHLREGDQGLIIEVRDNGIGIPPENLEKLFDPFFTTKPTGVGTGLGLSVVRKIVELHGGSIEMKNRARGGALVRITLKLNHPPADTPEVPAGT